MTTPPGMHQPGGSSRSIPNKNQDDDSASRITIFRGTFDRPDLADNAEIRLLVRGRSHVLVYLNGTPCELTTGHYPERAANLDLASLRDGKNVIAIVTEESGRTDDQSERDGPALVKIKTPSLDWKRKLFNGLAQIIVQSTTESGELKLIAEAPGLEKAVTIIATKR